MKYVKLFENWLNEAEEGKSEVKPFDPKKPGETLVVDITSLDFNQDDGKYSSRIMGSILGKCVKKNEKEKDSELTIIKFNIEEIRIPQYLKTATIFVKEGRASGVSKTIKMIIPNDLNLQEGDSVYYISKYSGEDWVSETGYPNILKKPKTFLFFPSGMSGDSSGNGFCLYEEGHLINWSDPKESIQAIKTTLGGICAFATSNFENLAILKDANAGKPQNIAKALGYEIPDNYAPKDGGIEVTTK